MQVQIAPDKFKGSLSAAQAADALAKGWREGWPLDKPLEIDCLPVADGGEGTAATRRKLRFLAPALSSSLSARFLTPLRKPSHIDGLDPVRGRKWALSNHVSLRQQGL
jgi:Glycerate kinase family